MNDINNYIDRCLLDEYASKHSLDGISLDIDSVPKHEIKNLLDLLMENDTYIKEMVLSEIQYLINKRIPDYEADNMYDFRQSLKERAA